jgi:4-amino-4-deoxy-L-arabinose transferase-like glycosyltransferase
LAHVAKGRSSFAAPDQHRGPLPCAPSVRLASSAFKGQSEFLYWFVIDDVRTVVLPARRVAIGWGILSLLLVYWAVARSFGAAQGLVAAALLSMVPEMLAHASIAGSDMPCAATMFLALLALTRYAERPSLARWMAVALAIGLAWAMRHAAILIIPLAVGVYLWVAFRHPGPSGVLAIGKRLAGTACASVALVILAFMLLWAADGLRSVPFGSDDNPSQRLRSIHNLGPFDVSRLPLPTSLLSLKFQLGHAKLGHRAYFCGERGLEGWMLYFPVAFLLKTPIGLLTLITLALVRVRPRGAWDWILLGCLVLLWIALVRNKIDIGLRYALLTYALIMPFIARLFEQSMLRDRI